MKAWPVLTGSIKRRIMGCAQMNSKLISQRINSDPSPFVIRLSDGTRVRVAHPDFVAVSPGQVLVIGRNESVTKIDPLHIVTLEEPRRKKSRANGQRPQ
ncbi:MAG: hypothetical protein HYY23_01280 [Verrucomicrobia bacterium]|nr:hypothetical protein [Verrucomicrobiota bacterium]